MFQIQPTHLVGSAVQYQGTKRAARQTLGHGSKQSPVIVGTAQSVAGGKRQSQSHTETSPAISPESPVAATNQAIPFNPIPIFASAPANMDYERIHKPFPSQSGGFSPARLRAMLLGVEKKRKEEEEMVTKFSLRSDLPECDDRRTSTAESCKDVECSIFMDTAGGHRARDYASGTARTRVQEEDGLDPESISSGFEFQRAERAPPHRMVSMSTLMAPFSKPAPSKWDDAQKWIASPTSNRVGGKGNGGQMRKGGLVAHGSRHGMTKVVFEVEEADTKRVDGCQAKKDSGGIENVNWVANPCCIMDTVGKPPTIMEDPVAEFSFGDHQFDLLKSSKRIQALRNVLKHMMESSDEELRYLKFEFLLCIKHSTVNLSQHDPLMSVQGTTTFVAPAPTIRSVSMRDMGTEMTPIPSQDPSRTGTPVRETSPLHSPTSSLPSTPRSSAASTAEVQIAPIARHDDSNKKELSEKELLKKTRREILVLGQQLGKTNITAWASKEVEETVASVSLETLPLEKSTRNVIEARAAAWEEAERSKYLARFKREEIKIQAWENHQKAKTEAEMRKIEVKVERMRARAHERVMNKLATSQHKAEEMRTAAEARRNRQAAKIAQQAEYIRRTGRVPSSFFFWSCCT
ncbi:hypothetical protein ZIOFF_008201 [Zingiber officinale]|uniref:Remorin C-terminal domain-containing protein n=1 Tax=Zingiber officinale TaxID=94328 RepID=A0A8J5IF50_ZINOF|nr:hypothetical protein ZIOFF_008201 [Zingiber officinale]